MKGIFDGKPCLVLMNKEKKKIGGKKLTFFQTGRTTHLENSPIHWILLGIHVLRLT